MMMRKFIAGCSIRTLLVMMTVCAVLTGCSKNSGRQEPTGTEEGGDGPAVTEVPETDENPYFTRAKGIAEDLSTKEKIEQLLILSSQNYNGEGFTVMNGEIQTMLEMHKYGGYLLFSSNCRNPEQTAGLIYDLQEAAGKENGIPMLVGIDQEGGYVTRLGFGTLTCGNMALGAAGQEGLVRSSAAIISSELKALGFNTDFAPVADVNNEPANPVIGIRSFSDDPSLAARLASSFASSLQENGISACAKHFPGHGNTKTDSHTGLPVSELTKEALEKTELVPFRNLLEADLIMTAHICFPEVENETCISVKDGSTITLPATLSRTFIQGILRDELGYQGVVVTDSLRMDAIAAHFDPKDAAVRALNAGADLLLMPVEVDSAEQITALDQYAEALAEEVGKSIEETRIDEAVIRVLTLKAKRGILDRAEKKSREEVISEANARIGTAENRTSERAVADQTVTVVRNENDLLPLKTEGTVLFAGIQSTQTDALQFGAERLQEEGMIHSPVRYANLSWGKGLYGVTADLQGVSAVVVTSWLDNLSQLDPAESQMISSIQELIRQCHASEIPVIVISTGLPYDLGCYPEADALLAVYNPVGAVKNEAGELTGPVGPGIPAAVDILFGRASPSATLPVSIPKAEGTGFSDEIVFERGRGITW